MQKNPSRINVEWLGKDIAPFLYGRSMRLLSPKREWVDKEDAEKLRISLRLLPRGSRLFGVQLRLIESESEFIPGQWYLELEHKGRFYSKRIIRITSVRTEEGRTWAKHEALWPSWVKDGEGGFATDFALNQEYGDRFYLKYTGSLPDEDHADSFFAKIMNMAMDFFTLEMIWSYASRELGSGDRRFDESFWLGDFGRRHPHLLYYEQVWDQLRFVLETESLQGINRIYDDGRSYRQRKDLITPILQAMQDDILSIFWSHPDIAEKVFSVENATRYWGKYIDVLFRHFQIGTAVIHIGDPAEEADAASVPDEGHRSRALKAIIEILKRHDTTMPGYYEAARNAYRTLTGKDYQTI